MLLVNCEIKIDLSWPENCIKHKISNTSEINANLAALPSIALASVTSSSSALFWINITKLYVLEVTLSINDNITFFRKLEARILKSIF